MVRLIYHPAYDIGFFGLERLHPFDSRKYGRAWRLLRSRFGSVVDEVTRRPLQPARHDDLAAIHNPAYLKRLRSPAYLASALEMPLLARVPAGMTDRFVLRPMRWATEGSLLAAREAMGGNLSVNLSGGYHHAKPDAGEGFCLYGDAAWIVHRLRGEGLLSDSDQVAYVDLDAHQGNGVCHFFLHDRRVRILDMYNRTAYPAYDTAARQRIDHDLPLSRGCGDDEYLGRLQAELPAFLDRIMANTAVGLAIYNAGTDVYAGDALGGLGLSADGVLQRDLFVIREMQSRNMSTVMLLSGGYSRASYKLVAETVARLLEEAPGA